MTGVYSWRRAVLVVAVVVALLSNPLLAAGVESGASDGRTASIPTLSDPLTTIDLNLTGTDTSTETEKTTTEIDGTTTTEADETTTTETDGLIGTLDETNETLTTLIDDTLNETEDTLNETEDALNDTGDALNETVETVNDTEETLDDTVENASETIEDTVAETNETVSDADGKLDDVDAALDDFEDVTVNVTVEDASAGETVAVNVPPAPEAGVAFDELGIEVKRDGDFELGATSSTDTFDAPALDGQPGTVPLGYVRLDHTIANEDVGNVTVTFAVDAERLDDADVDPENVALYRYSDGEWTELPTELVGQEDGRYVYRAASPGLSEFAAGAKQPSFEVPTATVETDSVAVGDDVAVQVRIENRGGADGVYEAALSFDGEVVVEREVSVAAEGSRVVTFRESVEMPGSYVVSINDVRAGEVMVEPAGTTTAPTSADPDEAAIGPSGGQPGFGPLVGLIGLVLWSMIVRRS